MLAADHIYITIPVTSSGAPDLAARKAIEEEIARVVEFHRLQRVARRSAPGIERFDYQWNGKRTHSIDFVTPIALPIPGKLLGRVRWRS
jgi:hypothetical protein